MKNETADETLLAGTMKLIRKIRLWFKEGSSDKIYEVELWQKGADRYVVNFRYGRRGGKLREGSKTARPLSREEADEIFDSLVVSKRNKGYRDSETVNPPNAPQASVNEARNDYLLKQLRSKALSGVKKNRIIWRIGELGLAAAAPLLIALIDNKNALRNYCIAWALGRCGDSGDNGDDGDNGDHQAQSALNKLRNSSRHDAVRRIALEALLRLGGEQERQRLYAEILHDLPPALKDALADKEPDTDRLSAALHAHLVHNDPAGYAVLDQLYALSGAYPQARKVLLQELRTAALKPSYFQRIRHIFKAAEFRRDSEVYGLIALRFETGKAYFHASPWHEYAAVPGEEAEYVKLKKEISRPDSRLAYSGRTRDYLRRRVWRTLRRLGELDDDDYVVMATGVLLPFTDEHAEEPRKAEVYQYDWSRPWDEARQAVATYHYDAYAAYVVFNHILYGNSRRYKLAKSGRAWQQQSADAPGAQREEAFPELWDRHPEYLLGLLSASRCEPVHLFAAKALRANENYCKQLPVTTLALLLQQPYEATIELAFAIARERYDPHEPDLGLIDVLLNAGWEPARRQALAWMDSAEALMLADAALLARLLGNRFADVREWAKIRIPQTPFSDAQTEAVITRLLSQALALGTEQGFHAAIASDIGQVLLDVFAARLRTLNLGVIDDLLRHPLTEVQVLAARLLLNHEREATTLPPGLFRTLLQARSAEVRGLGVTLFGRLPDETLLAQRELLLSFCLSELSEVRQSAHEIARRLAQTQAAYGRQLLADFLPYLFRKEPAAGFHDDLLAFLQSDALSPALAALDKDTVWRLLQARAKAAQTLGSHVLGNHIEPGALSVRQWAWLGKHAMLEVRLWTQQAYLDHVERVRAEAGDALRLLDNDWDDSREFAQRFFRRHFDAGDWTPELLIGICDSVREDVQAFGRELITQFFQDQHGADYLLKLSQHPSARVQLFVTRFIERFAAGRPERLNDLSLYFTTVLSRVNRGRVAKARILEFLHTEALKSAAAAEIVSKLFNRQSLTSAITDKAAYLQALRDIHALYPAVELVIAVKPLPVRERK